MADTKTLFRCKNVHKKMDKFELNNISFDIEPGYIMGIIGRNGSGKTTLLRTLMGSYKPEGDRIEIGLFEEGRAAKSASIFTNAKEYKEHMGFVLNDNPFHHGMNSLANGKIYGSYYKTFDFDKYYNYLLEFDVFPGMNIDKLSQGMKIKQQLAFALSYDCRVIFMDEPTGNLDMEFRDKFYKQVRQLVAKEDKCVIYASHLVEEMEEFADKLLWIKRSGNVSNQFYFGLVDDLKERYRLVEMPAKLAEQLPKDIVIGGRSRENHSEYLIKVNTEGRTYIEGFSPSDVRVRIPSLREVMYYIEKQASAKGQV